MTSYFFSRCLAFTTVFALSLGVGNAQIVTRPKTPVSAGPAQSTTDAQPESSQTPDVLHQFDASLRKLTERVSPAVVEIMVSAYGPLEHRATGASVIGQQHAIGSGVIVDPSGYIMTNAHVIENAQRVQVVLTDVSKDHAAAGLLVPIGQIPVYEAKVIGKDTQLDLALLKIDGKNLPHIPLADFSKVRQGQLVVAVGSPQGLENTATMGIISAVARQPDPDQPMVYIQTDAPINPGNSGGALVDIDGHLVGINTFIYSESGGSQGLGFAIPAPVIRFAYESFRKKGHIDRREIGVAAQSITPDIAAALGLRRTYGLMISDVVPGSMAEASGIQIGDVILTVDGREVDTLPLLQGIVTSHPGDQLLRLSVLRGKERLQFDVPVIERKDTVDSVADNVNPQTSTITQLGLLAVDLTDRIAKAVPNLRIPNGALVIGRTATGGNLNGDLRSGDIIHAINQTPITNLEDLRRATQNVKTGQVFVLQIERDGALQFSPCELE